MKHGRILRVTRPVGSSYATYVVAEESAEKAIALVRTRVGSYAEIVSIGRASLRLLSELSLSPGEFRKGKKSVWPMSTTRRNQREPDLVGGRKPFQNGTLQRPPTSALPARTSTKRA
jgi:hypothetical protein